MAGHIRVYTDINEILNLLNDLHSDDEEVGEFNSDDSDIDADTMHRKIEESTVFIENNNTEIDTILQGKNIFIDNQGETSLDCATSINTSLNYDISIPTHSEQHFDFQLMSSHTPSTSITVSSEFRTPNVIATRIPGLTRSGKGFYIPHDKQLQVMKTRSTPVCETPRAVRQQQQQHNYADSGRDSRCFQFTADPGVHINPPDQSSPISVLKTFLTDELMETITKHTNDYAQYLINLPSIQESIQKKKLSIFQLWKPINKDEMWLYLTLMIMMSIVTKPEYPLY